MERIDDLYSSDMLYSHDDEIAYIRAFKKKFGKVPFYFNDIFVVEAKNARTIPGVRLDESTCRELTEVLTKRFKLAKKYAVLVYRCNSNPYEFDSYEEAEEYAESQFDFMEVGKVKIVDSEDFENVIAVYDE
jgi:hypothetical protein